MKSSFWLLVSGFLCLTILAEASWAEVKITSDITRLSVGARPLGMGKMFTGLSDDISAIYLNPSGLANQDTLQVLSMSGQFVKLVNYFTLATSLPLGGGTIGVGYSSAGLGFSTPILNLVEIATGEYRVIPSTETVSYNYGNSAICLAYAQNLFRPDLSIGANLKLFTENISGASAADAHGYEMDLGFLFKPNPSLTLGALAKNVLPASLGGKIVWNTNLEESFPLSLNLGGSFKLDTKRFGELIIGTDYEMKPTQSNLPALLHAGVEWWPVKILAVRGGIDQDVIGKDSGTELETTNNPTAGVSLKIANVRFDVAYHRYNDISSNDTYYFSIVYQPEKILPIEITSPKDKTITDEVTVLVKGKVKNPNIKVLKVNDIEVNLINGSFEQETSLMPGKNAIWVIGLDNKGRPIERKKIRVLRLVKFTDIPADFWAKETIQYLGTLNIIPAYSDGTFRPNEKINRYKLLLNLLNVGKIPPATDLKPYPFRDVKIKDKIASYVKAGYDERIILGYPDKTFRPWKEVTRLEAALMAVRFSGFSISSARERPFEDIDARHWAINEINTAKEKSLVGFFGKELHPTQTLTRAELAVILSKTPVVSAKIEELLDFEKGYEQ